RQPGTGAARDAAREPRAVAATEAAQGEASEHVDSAGEVLEVVEVAVDRGGCGAGVDVAYAREDRLVLRVDLGAVERRLDRDVEARLEEGVQGKKRDREHAILRRGGDLAVEADVEFKPPLGRERRVARSGQDPLHRRDVRG